MVLVPFTVIDDRGQTIHGLRAPNFTVFDDRIPQPIASFAAEDAPCSVGLVLDVSGSMRNALATAKSVTHAFFKTSNPDDDYLLLTVSTQPNGRSFSGNTEELEHLIDSTTSGGLTALFDTVYLGFARMQDAKHPRRALLVLSDGIDNHSQRSNRDLMRAALEASVQVYTILIEGSDGVSTSTIPSRPVMLQKPWEQLAGRQGPQNLKELAEKTGGLTFHVRGQEQAAQAASRISRALRNEYVIGYYPTVSATGRKWHEIRVKSNVPKTYVSARGGYYSP